MLFNELTTVLLNWQRKDKVA